MKRHISLIMVMVCTMLAFMTVEARDKDQAAIKFESTTHDFGTIKEADGKVTCEFVFTNTGKAPLVIISANASCGCTKPIVPQEPIAPGATARISVSYNPAGRPGEFNKNITVRTNAPKNKKVILRISGVVVPK